MTSMSYVFVKLMASVLFEAFLLGVKKISLKKRLISLGKNF
jgi:hypothetical protein